jgi:hypothetical protein
MRLATFGTASNTLLSVGAGALTQSPDYSFLALPLAEAAGAFWIILLAIFVYRNWKEVRVWMTSWYFIGPCFALALISATIGAYALGLRSHTSEPIKTVADSSTTSSPTPASPTPIHFLQGAFIEWGGSGRLSLRGRTVAAAGPLSVYVTYGHALGGVPAASVINGMNAIEPRIKIATIPHFDRDEAANITVGVISGAGNQQIVQWGEPAQNNTKVGVVSGSYFGHIIFVFPDGREDHYPFAIVGTSDPSKPTAPVVLGPNLLSGTFQPLPSAPPRMGWAIDNIISNNNGGAGFKAEGNLDGMSIKRIETSGNKGSGAEVKPK